MRDLCVQAFTLVQQEGSHRLDIYKCVSRHVGEIVQHVWTSILLLSCLRHPDAGTRDSLYTSIPLYCFCDSQCLQVGQARPNAGVLSASQICRLPALLRVKLLLDFQEGKVPKLQKILEEESDEEEVPDQEIQIPEHKVKLVVGPGGDKIKFIQRKSKCRLQVMPIA